MVIPDKVKQAAMDEVRKILGANSSQLPPLIAQLQSGQTSEAIEILLEERFKTAQRHRELDGLINQLAGIS